MKSHNAPKVLTGKAKVKWEADYAAALKQAKNNHPDDELGQHTVALKEANKMLAVPAPDSAEAIDALEDWQVVKREARVIEGVEHATCVTIDGRKYAHPKKEKELTKAEKDAAKKAEEDAAKAAK